MSWVAGVDGCRAGWIAALRRVGSREWRFRFAESFKGVLCLPERPIIIAVDMPMGFLSSARRGGRTCEKIARSKLPNKSSSVFSSPTRAALRPQSYESASEANRATSSSRIGLTQQAWHLGRKLREIDSILTTRPQLRDRVFEAHPELAFMRLAQQPVHEPKRKAKGRAKRAEILEKAGFRGSLDQLRRLRKRYGLLTRDLGNDDGLDAAAVCITAERILAQTDVVLPSRPPLDSRGIQMAIRY